VNRAWDHALCVDDDAPTSIENVAYHEAGHAAVALGIGATVGLATIKPHGDIEGKVTVSRGRCRYIESSLFITLAGPFAQRRFAPRSDWRNANHDFAKVKKEVTLDYGRGTAAQEYHDFLEARAEQLVDEWWIEIEDVAAALLKYETMTGREIRAVMHKARRKPRRRP
jgi:hypothetical protein